jgi:hypothetical protein
MRVYLCSPYNGGDNTGLNPSSLLSELRQRRERNKRYALDVMLRLLNEKKDAVFVPHFLYTSVLNDDIKLERRTGLNAGIEFLKVCDMLLVCDSYGISEGMSHEIDYAKQNGIRVAYINEYMPKIINKRI